MVVGSTQGEDRKRLETLHSIHNHTLHRMDRKYHQRTEPRLSQEKLDRRIDREFATSTTTTPMLLTFGVLHLHSGTKGESDKREWTGHFTF